MEDTALGNAVISDVGTRIVGQQYMVERLLIGLLTGGHVLWEGVGTRVYDQATP
jgi:MoxR-like ATPase